MGSIPAWRTKVILFLKGAMKRNNKTEPRYHSKEKADAALSYIPFLSFVTFFKNDLTDFAKKHAKQGMVLLIIEVTALFFLIDVISKIFWTLILIICFVVSLIGISKSLSGKEMKIPILSYFLDKYDI